MRTEATVLALPAAVAEGRSTGDGFQVGRHAGSAATSVTITHVVLRSRGGVHACHDVVAARRLCSTRKGHGPSRRAQRRCRQAAGCSSLARSS